MKYVMFTVTTKGKGGRAFLTRKLPIIFPEDLVHKIVADYVGDLLQRVHGYVDVRPVSAGFIRLGGKLGLEGKRITVEDGVNVYGTSESLKLSHDPEDARMITLYDYNHGLDL